MLPSGGCSPEGRAATGQRVPLGGYGQARDVWSAEHVCGCVEGSVCSYACARVVGLSLGVCGSCVEVHESLSHASAR